MSHCLSAIECETAPAPRFSVIWLHGLGADGNDFVPVVPELRLPPLPGVRFIFPHAPTMPVTCNGGYVMRAWYDIKGVDGINRSVDEAGIIASREEIRCLIARENERGIPCSRIILVGFSQGGAMAYTTGLTHAEKLAGVAALSAYIPAPGLLLDERTQVNCETPVFAAHGTEDPVVPFELGEAARDILLQQGYNVTWHAYRMPHAVCIEEIAAIGEWLTGCLCEAAMSRSGG